jgi:hypothetical protein
MNPERQTRYDRWRKAADELALEHDGPDFDGLLAEEQAAWDDMADSNDSAYNRILDGFKP